MSTFCSEERHFGNNIQKNNQLFYIKKLKKIKKGVDLFPNLLYYKYAIKTQVSHKPVQDKKFYKERGNEL